MRLEIVAALALAAMLSPGISAAQGSAEANGDAVAGKSKAYTCTGCHGITGYRNVYPHYHVPKISGQNYQYLVTALNEYRTGARKHPTMVAQAESLSEQDILDIAAYLANPPAP